MKGIFSIFRKDDRAFTGLESAIVLTAFVVVAAVFSYVVLGAGFTTSDTAKKTIDEGVKQTTSSVEIAGDVIAEGTPITTTTGNDGKSTTSGGTVDTIIVPLQLTAGQSPVDIGANSGQTTTGEGGTATTVDNPNAGVLVVSYADSEVYKEKVMWAASFVGAHDADYLLEQHEKVQLTITVPEGSLLNPADNSGGSGENKEFRLEIKPKVGAIVPITRVTPAQIDKVMVLK
jgi:flagellin FlaB